MPIPADLDFYAHRERQERTLAERAGHPEGRRIHLEMAYRYARMIQDAEVPPISAAR